MKTDIEFLRVLEEDLAEAATRETANKNERPTRSQRARIGSTWMRVAAAVIALLLVAGGIGVFAQRRSDRSALAGSSDLAHRGNDVAPAFSPLGRGGTTYSTPPVSDIPQADLAKIVRNGSITIQIPDNTFAARSLAVTKVAAEARGIVLTSSTQNQRTGTFTLKVPANNFQSAMTALAALGAVQSSDQTGTDVTSRYVDYSARIRILTGRRAVVLKLMSKATTISDTLYLQNQFDDVQLQIEQIQGSLNVLRNQVAESTITLAMAEKDSPKPPTVSGVSTPSSGKALRLAWQGTLRVVDAILIGLGYLIPIAILSFGVLVIMRETRRRRAASSAL